MRSHSSVIASAVGVALLYVAVPAHGQGGPQQVARVASVAAGSIAGLVHDEQGRAIVGAVVSAVGSDSVFTVTDRRGHFELRSMPPGPYLVRAHLSGFSAPQGQIVEVRSSARAASSIAMRRVTEASSGRPKVLAAGVAGFAEPTPAAESPDGVGAVGPSETEGTVVDDDHTEVAWRLRHARRGVLKDATLPGGFIQDDGRDARVAFGQPGLFGRAAESSVRFASSLFGSTPFSGQLHLLTAGSFDTAQQLFSTDGFARSIAHLSLTAPVGEHADWTVRGALTQGDVSSWVVAGAYATRGPARHRYDFGASYGTQQYGTGSSVVWRDATGSSRSAGAVYGFDTFAVTQAVSVTYGARVARYDYLGESALVSPRLGLTVSPGAHFRINALVSRRATAPGAEEFVPPAESALWLPPQRTFSPLAHDRKLAAERTGHLEVGVERDIPGATLSLGTFRQHVDDQVATIFGIDGRDRSTSHLGHYLVANIGSANTSGWSAGLYTSPAHRVHGSVKYAQSRARWNGGDDLAYVILFAPAITRIESGQVHDVKTTVETEVPETSTRVLVLYQVSNAFATATDRLAFDSRFDVQVRQSLPFMDFSSARWEMLFAVRNVFRETAEDSSVYDELLMVRPPKRIVGGLTLRF